MTKFLKYALRAILRYGLVAIIIFFGAFVFESLRLNDQDIQNLYIQQDDFEGEWIKGYWSLYDQLNRQIQLSCKDRARLRSETMDFHRLLRDVDLELYSKFLELRRSLEDADALNDLQFSFINNLIESVNEQDNRLVDVEGSNIHQYEVIQDLFEMVHVEEPQLEDLYLQVLSSVVTIHRENGGYGSGVIIDQDKGYILTAAHVTIHCDGIIVQLYNGERFYVEEIAVDSRGDVALLRVLPGYIAHLQIVELRIAELDGLNLGEEVFTISTPYYMEDIISYGVLSRKITNEVPGMSAYGYDYFIIDAIAGPGSSGCPVFDLDLNIVGLVIGPVGQYIRVASCATIRNLMKVQE